MKKIIIGLVLLSVTPAYSQGLSLRGIWDDVPFEKFQGRLPEADDEQHIEPNYSYSKNVKFDIIPEEPDVIYFPNEEIPGTVIVDTKNKRLFYVIDNEEAFVYPVGVGRKGFTWSGVEKVSRIQEWPSWTPPPEMLKRRPDLPAHMEGGIRNPLGAVAIYLGNTLYRIHGTNDPKSIGRADSSGCIRMMNEHVVHLANLVDVGTIVKVYK